MTNSGIDHEHTARIGEAALWLATSYHKSGCRNVIVELRDRFGLTALQATEAIREANLIRARAT